MQDFVLNDPHSFHRGPTYSKPTGSRVTSWLHSLRVQLNPHLGGQLAAPQVSVNMYCSVRAKQECSPLGLDSWLVSQFTVVCSVKVTAA